MQDSELGEAKLIIEEVPSSLEWHVIHLRYPRKTQKYSSLQIKWVRCGTIKLPKFFFQHKTLERQDAPVNYDLLSEQIESLLNTYSLKGYELFSMTPTQTGSFSIVPTQARPQHHFLKPSTPKNSIKGDEVLFFIFKKRGSLTQLER